ncbi:MAG: hypothetical protein IJU68_01950 [Bacteroidales bacterium]|nr:hypothetical protein [Bacteroidales bacterium]
MKFPSPDYTTQDGTLEYIATHCDYAEATVTIASINDGNITTTGAANFVNQQAIVRFTLKKYDGTALPGNPTALTVTDGTSTVSLTGIPAATYTANGASGVLYVALIILVNSTTRYITPRNVALALEDEGCGLTDFSGAESAIAQKNTTTPVTGVTWELPYWGQICEAVGYQAVRDGFSSVGGTNMQASGYWGLEYNETQAFVNYFFDGHSDLLNKTNIEYVRASIVWPYTPGE